MARRSPFSCSSWWLCKYFIKGKVFIKPQLNGIKRVGSRLRRLQVRGSDLSNANYKNIIMTGHRQGLARVCSCESWYLRVLGLARVGSCVSWGLRVWVLRELGLACVWTCVDLREFGLASVGACEGWGLHVLGLAKSILHG